MAVLYRVNGMPRNLAFEMRFDDTTRILGPALNVILRTVLQLLGLDLKY
jgi:hypothetical protein